MRTRMTLPTLLVVLAFGLLLGPSAMAVELTAAQELQTRLGEEQYTGQYSKVPPMREAIMTEDGRVRLIIQLEDPPLASYRGGIGSFRATSPRATGARKLNVRGGDAVAYRGYLQERQGQFERQLLKAAPGIRVGHRYQVVFNGLSVAVDPARVGAISRMAGVKKVYPSKRYYQVMDSSLPLINALSFWSVVGGRDSAGAGIKVAIVDGGIRPENPMFDDTGFPSPGMDYPAPGDYCDTVDETFCNNKLISARHFNDDITLHPDEVDSPLGINGHGTHVAGSAVGNYVEGADLGDGVLENVSGVAPGAWLMVCKGLWWNGTTGSGGSGDLIACVDSMVADGADVINNSYGGGGGGDPRSDAFGEVFENAEAAGVVAVAAAGNDGPGARTIGCPGCQPSVLTVANSTHGRIHALSVDVDFPPAVQSTLPLSGLGCLEGTGVPFTGTVGPDPIVYAGDVDAANFEGCDPFPAMSMDGAIALISRGSCAFATKVAEAEAAGAVATIVFNNLPGTPIVMGGLNAGETISSCMLSNDQGILVRDHVQANPGAPGTINFPQSRVTNENWEDFIASGSSRGPNGWADILKPEIAAPGTNIFSAWSPDAPGSPGPSDFTIISGTSMASPHIAGAAALVMQQNPGWEPWQVKSALTSTTVQDLVKEDGMTPADPFDFGAGRVDLDRAKDAGLTFDQVSIADGSCVVECGFERMVRNELALPATWNAFVELDGDMMDPQAIVESGIQIEVEPSSLLLDPGENAFFSVYVDTSLAEQGEWHFARIRWVYSGPPTGAVVPDAVMPMAIFAAASTNPAFLAKTVDKEVAQPTEVLSYQIDLTNLTITEPINLVDFIPENSNFIPGSEWSTEPGFTYNPGSDSLSWTGTLDPLTMEIVPGTSPFGYLPLSIFFGPQPCSSSCDDTSNTLSVPGFDYLGTTYTSVVMSSNGFFIVGDNDDGAADPTNQELPNPGAPNNVIAPFWTDIDMLGTDPEDDGAGIWYAGILTDGVNTFLIMEWEAVELWGEPGPTYTFQVWITLETGEIDFVYAAIPSVPTSLTVGAEDSSGTAGTSYYYDGAGTAPEVGTDLTVIAEGSVASFYFQTEAGWEIGQPIINIVEAYTGINGTDGPSGVNGNGMFETAAAITQVEEPDVALFIEGECPGTVNVFGFGATPGGYVRVYRGDWPGTTAPPFRRRCAGTEVELDRASQLPPTVRADGEGSFNFTRRLFPFQCDGRLQAVDMGSCNVSTSVPLSEESFCGNCYEAHGFPGCEFPACEAAVCAIDSFCCDVEWDSICADEARDICGPAECGGMEP